MYFTFHAECSVHHTDRCFAHADKYSRFRSQTCCCIPATKNFCPSTEELLFTISCSKVLTKCSYIYIETKYCLQFQGNLLYKDTESIIRFVIPVVFNKLRVIRVQCMFLSNTTCLFDGRGVFTSLPKVQLHISALDNNHLQVVHESLKSSYTKFNMGCVQWGFGG